MSFDIELFFRLVVAIVLGGIIGFERGGTKHAAGLRTHSILCLGSALVMVISEVLVEKYDIHQEIMRMGAQIISGVGFLGAGSIIMTGGQLYGITTAAGLWTTACVGIAVGTGNYLFAIFTVFLMMLVMLGLRSLSVKIRNESVIYSFVADIKEVEKTSDIFNEVTRLGGEIINTKIRSNEESETVMEFEMHFYQKIQIGDFVTELSSKGISVKEISLKY